MKTKHIHIHHSKINKIKHDIKKTMKTTTKTQSSSHKYKREFEQNITKTVTTLQKNKNNRAAINLKSAIKNLKEINKTSLV